MRGDVLLLPSEFIRPDVILKVQISYCCSGSHIEIVLSKAHVVPHCLTIMFLLLILVTLFVVQGNQMTLVFMEREYPSPEDPHSGVVHIVEVTSGSNLD